MKIQTPAPGAGAAQGIVAAHRRRDRLAVGEVVNTKKMAKHFALDIYDGHFSWARKVDQITAEAKLDGIYVVKPIR